MSNHCRTGRTVLIAEDEEGVRLLAAHTIKAAGFDVLTASSAEEALHFWERHSNEIVLLFTDIVMPGSLTGYDAARQIRAKSPALPVIFSSGHSGVLFSDSVELQKGVIYLPKPYRQIELSALISMMLGSSARKAGALAA
jgi:CheY-like chemotaxis protein